MDDNSPLMRPIKNAFYERATEYAAVLQEEVEEGRMSRQDAAKHLTEIMSKPEMMKAVIAASRIKQATH